MKSSLVVLACASFAIAIAACHTPGTPPPPPHTAFDAAQFPAGDGWFCYKANEGYDAAPCERAKDACDVNHKKDVNAKTECTRNDVAYCFAVNGPTPTKACYGSQRECTNASNVTPAAGSPTDCGTVK